MSFEYNDLISLLYKNNIIVQCIENQIVGNRRRSTVTDLWLISVNVNEITIERQSVKGGQRSVRARKVSVRASKWEEGVRVEREGKSEKKKTKKTTNVVHQEKNSIARTMNSKITICSLIHTNTCCRFFSLALEIPLYTDTAMIALTLSHSLYAHLHFDRLWILSKFCSISFLFLFFIIPKFQF